MAFALSGRLEAGVISSGLITRFSGSPNDAVPCFSHTPGSRSLGEQTKPRQTTRWGSRALAGLRIRSNACRSPLTVVLVVVGARAEVQAQAQV